MLVLLRSLDGFLLLGSFFLVSRIRSAIFSSSEASGPTSIRPRDPESPDACAGSVLAAIVCFFPPLFFFSGLFYTDILSILLVLAATASHYRQGPVMASVWSLLSLTVRQTNVFWTGVYLAGLETVQGPTSEKMDPSKKSASLFGIIQSIWSSGKLFDEDVQDAFIEGSSSIGAISLF